MVLFKTSVCAAVFAAILTPASGMGEVPAPAVAPPAEVNLSRMTMGYTYYNRPGADLKIHDAEVADCAAEGARTLSFDEIIHNGANQGVLGALIGSAFQSAYHRGAAAAGLENCMVVHGWRVVKLPDDEGLALTKLAPADLSTRMAPWVGDDQPHGQIVRIWQNDAANAANQRTGIRPDHTNDGQLSLREATGGDLHQLTTVGQPIDASRDELDPKWPKRPLAANKLASAPDGSVILLVQIKGLGFRNGTGVMLNRIGTDKDVSPSHSDHGPDQILAVKGILFAHREGDLFAFAVPPGRWRVKGLVSAGGLNFCLGAPAFEVKTGEVVYAGSFDLSAANIGPDLDLAPAKAWLAGLPQAQAVRPAVYINGSRSVCGDSAIYALEVDGAPFEPGYAWGGAQRATPVVNAAGLPAPATVTPPPSKAPAVGGTPAPTR